ncbi:MAG: metal ABC transporter ATP-binding protein [bacterium]|nr:metal ABC transporter ATP-binding protein [bacterium]
MSADTDTAPPISLCGASFAYGSRVALENVCLDVPAGDFISVIGPNGGGKTTLLKLILGLLKPAEGTVRVYGVPPRRARRRMGYTPQHAHHDPKFPVTVMDVVLMGRLDRHWGGRYAAADRDKAMDALREMELADLPDRPFEALSGGQRQRVLIARALVSDPDVLLLDEPTANVDAMAGNRLLELLAQLNDRMTILMVSHDLGFVAEMVRHVICVNRNVVMHPTSDITGETIKDIYGAELRMVRHDHHIEGHDHG